MRPVRPGSAGETRSTGTTPWRVARDGATLEAMSGSAYTTVALEESTWPAFASLVEANGGIFGGCWCIGFHAEGPCGDPALNRSRKLARVREATTHAALVLRDGECVGWCQFGTPEELPRIKNRAAWEKGLIEPPDWRIACNYVG